ncbi:hypothetical protein VV02_23965 [Luteipulveratus mongoliensis]|uniref:Uncharacterized protein n=1 Tax=Luteipulveratus mongoliensis TaxID=571913 RepID=A0A0K1JNM8_9MICO|nr:hypothetical protein VV02_23965 [Luteipulveratus mongoliensis]
MHSCGAELWLASQQVAGGAFKLDAFDGGIDPFAVRLAWCLYRWGQADPWVTLQQSFALSAALLVRRRVGVRL